MARETVDQMPIEAQLGYYADLDDVFTVNRIIEDGFPVDKPIDNRGNTALHVAAGHNAPRVVKLLLELGANVDAINSYGNTPLYTAVKARLVEITRILLDNKANVDAINNLGQTALYSAVINPDSDSIALVDLLLQKGADPSLADALKIAREQHVRPILKLMEQSMLKRNNLEHGEDKAQQQTPYQPKLFKEPDSGTGTSKSEQNESDKGVKP